jgi:hypothetical protein
MRHTEYASDILFSLRAAQPGLTFIMVSALQHIWRECIYRCQPALSTQMIGQGMRHPSRRRRHSGQIKICRITDIDVATVNPLPSR